jgi:hypothetical protein
MPAPTVFTIDAPHILSSELHYKMGWVNYMTGDAMVQQGRYHEAEQSLLECVRAFVPASFTIPGTDGFRPEYSKKALNAVDMFLLAKGLYKIAKCQEQLGRTSEVRVVFHLSISSLTRRVAQALDWIEELRILYNTFLLSQFDKPQFGTLALTTPLSALLMMIHSLERDASAIFRVL